MLYEITVRHFAQRTRQNLKAIDDLSRNEPNRYFEVTQLINSSIGLLMSPQQEFFDHLLETGIEELRADGWPIPHFEYGKEVTSNLRQIVRYIRNSIAHFNIDFKPDGGKIAGIYLWNRPNETSPPDWLCYISVSELHELFDRVARIAEKAAANHTYREMRVKHVRHEINSVRQSGRSDSGRAARHSDSNHS